MKSDGVSALEALVLDAAFEAAPLFAVGVVFDVIGATRSLTASGEMDMIAPRF
jgi:hypothetical protein